MKRVKIIALLLLIFTLVLIAYCLNPNFLSTFNLQNLARKSSLLSIYAVGVGVVIMAGGIDLSLGSLVALSGSGYITTLSSEQ